MTSYAYSNKLVVTTDYKSDIMYSLLTSTLNSDIKHGRGNNWQETRQKMKYHNVTFFYLQWHRTHIPIYRKK